MNFVNKIILITFLFGNEIDGSLPEEFTKIKMPFKKFEICENLSEQPFSELYNTKNGNINLVIKNNKECFLECDILSSPKPIINWYKNDKLHQSHLDNILDHTDDYLNSKNMNSQIGWSSILSKIQIYSNNVGDQFKCEIISPCINEKIISDTYTIPEFALHSCSKNYDNIHFLKNLNKNNIFSILSYFNPYQSLYIKTPVITTATTMRMEYPGNFITLSCKNEAYPKATNKWEVIENDNENGSGISIDNFNYFKVSHFIEKKKNSYY